MTQDSRANWNGRFTKAKLIAEDGRVVSWQRSPSLRQSIVNWTADRGLGIAGAGAALASAVFAIAMMRTDVSNPQFGGAEYLDLFTRPLHPLTLPNQQAAAPRFEGTGIDYTATGSINTGRQQPVDAVAGTRLQTQNQSLETPPAPSHPIKGYTLRNVTGGVAVIDGPKGVFVVENGSFMPNGDKVVSIDRHAGHWVVVTTSGTIGD